MSETLGGLVDKLCVTNNKLWATQDYIIKWSKMSGEDFKAQGYEAIHKVIMDLYTLNLDRNRLMREIDECFADGCRTGKPRVDARVKLT